MKNKFGLIKNKEPNMSNVEQFTLYHLKDLKFFLTKNMFDKPDNIWIKKYPIITKRKYMGCYDSFKIRTHAEWGIENVRSDEDIFETSIDLSPLDEYEYTIKLDEYYDILDQTCETCGKGGHNKDYCEETEDIMGYTIFENMPPEEEYISDEEDENEEENEEENEPYTVNKRYWYY